MFKGRFLGVAALVAVQVLIGVIHVVFGFAMLSGSFSVATVSVTPLVLQHLHRNLRVADATVRLFGLGEQTFRVD